MTGAATAPKRYRMRDLCELSGLPRQAIHFYIKEGLLPEGEKTGRNQATYGEEHVERLRLIRQLQEERFLPLKAIKQIVAPAAGGLLEQQFTPVQRDLLSGLKRRFATRVGPLSTRMRTRAFVEARPHLERLGVSADELEELASGGLVEVERAATGPRQIRIARSDLFVVEAWAALKQEGFTRKLGFRPADLRLYAVLAETLVRDEAALLAERLAGRSPDVVAEMLDRALPIATHFFARYHEKLARAFLVRQS